VLVFRNFALTNTQSSSELTHFHVLCIACFFFLRQFNDFVDCAQHLIREHYTAADRLAIVGRSAGGLLIGATVNMRPDLFRVAVADVPFVDALTT
jgi:hypothetical protein